MPWFHAQLRASKRVSNFRSIRKLPNIPVYPKFSTETPKTPPQTELNYPTVNVMRKRSFWTRFPSHISPVACQVYSVSTNTKMLNTPVLYSRRFRVAFLPPLAHDTIYTKFLTHLPQIRFSTAGEPFRKTYIAPITASFARKKSHLRRPQIRSLPYRLFCIRILHPSSRSSRCFNRHAHTLFLSYACLTHSRVGWLAARRIRKGKRYAYLFVGE